MIRINGGETYRVLRLAGALIFTNNVITNGRGKSLVADNENISLFRKSYNRQHEIKRFLGIKK